MLECTDKLQWERCWFYNWYLAHCYSSYVIIFIFHNVTCSLGSPSKPHSVYSTDDGSWQGVTAPCWGRWGEILPLLSCWRKKKYNVSFFLVGHFSSTSEDSSTIVYSEHGLISLSFRLQPTILVRLPNCPVVIYTFISSPQMPMWDRTQAPGMRVQKLYDCTMPSLLNVISWHPHLSIAPSSDKFWNSIRIQIKTMDCNGMVLGLETKSALISFSCNHFPPITSFNGHYEIKWK